jgi:hypothetical protein
MRRIGIAAAVRRMSPAPSNRLHTLTLVGVLSAGCTGPARETSPSLVLEQLRSPTERPASALQLATSDSRAILSWLERSDDGRTLLLVERLADSWSAPHPVATGEELLDNSADVPSLHVLGGRRLAAQWLARLGPTRCYLPFQTTTGRPVGSRAASSRRDGDPTRVRIALSATR